MRLFPLEHARGLGCYRGPRVSGRARKILIAALCLVGAALAWLPIPETEVTNQKPYANYIGREYRVVGTVSAYAWNDFPDKNRILSVTLTPPPGTRNRFVSSVTPLRTGQR